MYFGSELFLTLSYSQSKGINGGDVEPEKDKYFYQVKEINKD
jgi:hypothetical protein